MPLIKVGAKRLHYTLYPPADSTSPKGTVICHHGLGSSQNFYTTIVPTLTSSGFRVVTFDTTGAARSPYTQVEQSVSSLAADVLGLLDELNVKEKVVVAGHSMGGIVACHLAAEHAERVRGVVLIGPVYPSEAVSKVFEKRIETVEKEGMEAMANTIPFAAVGETASPVAKAFIRELLLGQDKWGYLSNCRVIASAKRPRYEEISCPVLLLAGKEDKSAPLDTSKKMIQEIGSDEKLKQLRVLDEVGHWHCIEAPEAVEAHIVEFLEALA